MHPTRVEDASRAFPAPAMMLVLVTLVGLVLRTIGIGLDLWIDEIATLDDIRTATVPELLTSYTSANRHVLNSVLVSLSISAFGEHEWSVRLPAMLFGAASVPVLYWVAGLAGLSRMAAVGAALLLAVSYHHVWFSQNARGYTAYIFFSLLGTGALVRLLESPRRRWQAIFVAASAFNFLALLPSVCVFGAQVLAAVTALVIAARRGELVKERVRGVAIALLAAAGAAVVIFTPLIVEMFAVLSRDAPAQVTAYRFWSVAFFQEILLGLLGGAPAIWLVVLVCAAAAGGCGLIVLMRRAPVVTGVLVGAHILFVGVTVMLGWPVYPRLFALGLPLAILIVLAAADTFDARKSRLVRGVAVPVVIGILAAGFLAMLARTYGMPKQPYRAALLQLGRMSGPDSIAVAVGVADRGIAYYENRVDEKPARLEYARTLEAFDEVRKRHPERPVYLVSTVNSALAAEKPDLWNVMQDGWRPVVTLPATVRGGELTIWAPAVDAAP